MEGAVRHHGAHDLADGPYAALGGGVQLLHHQGGAAHPHDEAVPAPVERDRRVFHPGVGGRDPGGHEPGREPREQVVGGRVVARDHDDPAATPLADEIVGQRHGLGARGARPVRGEVGTPGADVLGELGVPHVEHLEQEAAVEVIRMGRQLVPQRRDARVQLHRGRAVVHQGPGRLQLGQTVTASLVPPEALDDAHEEVEAWPSGTEDDAGIVPHVIGKPPSQRELGPGARGPEAAHQGDPGVPEGVDPRGDGQLGGPVQGPQPVLGEPVLGNQVELAGTAGELDHVFGIGDGLEPGRALGALHEAGDAPVQDRVAQLLRHRRDEHVPTHDLLQRVVVEDPLAPGESHRHAGDPDARRCLLPGPSAGVELEALVQELGEHAPEGDVAVLGRRRGGRRGAHHRRSRSLGAHHRDRRSVGNRHALLAHTPPQPHGPEPAQRPVHLHHVGGLGVVGEEHGDALAAAYHVHRHPVQGPLGAHLHEDPAPGVVQRVQRLHPLHRRADLPAQDLHHLLRRIGTGGVEPGIHVGHHGDPRRPQIQPPQHVAQRRRRRLHDAGVERMAHRELDHSHPCGLERGHGAPHSVGLTTDDALLGGVHVGHHHVAFHGCHDLVHLLQRAEHRRHEAVVLQGEACHGIAAGGHRHQRVGEGHPPRRHERAVLAQAVPHDHVGLDPPRREQAGQGRIHGEHGGLGDGGLLQGLLGRSHPRRVARIHEDLGAQGLASQQGSHDPVGLVERFLHDGLGGLELGEHPHVLGPLPGEEERHLPRRRAPAQVGALVAERFPAPFVLRLQSHDHLLGQLRQLPGIPEVQRHAHVGAQVGLGGRRRRGRPPRLRPCRHVAQARGHRSVVGTAHQERASERGLGRRCAGGASARHLGALRHRLLRPAQPGHVLLQDEVEVGPAEAEGAHAGPADPVAARLLPGARLCDHLEGRSGEVVGRVGRGEVGAGKEHLVVQRQRGLHQSGGACPGLQVPDVGFHRSQGHRLRGEAPAPEDPVQHLQLGHVPRLGGGAVPLDHVAGLERGAGAAPPPLHGEALSHRIGGGDALPLSVRRRTHPHDDGIDPVAVALGVGQALQEENAGPLPHHEPVGPFGVGTAVPARERADLAELHERGRVHVGVDAAGEDRVVVVLDEPLHRSRHGRQGRGACRVGDVVGALEVPQLCHAPCHDVAELTGHGVLGDVGEPVAHPGEHLLEDGAADLRRQRAERGSLGQLLPELGEEDVSRRQKVVVAPQSVPEDDPHVLGVQGALGIAVVQERFPARGHGPPLGQVHLRRHPGRDGHAPADGIPGILAHPSADLRVGLGRRLGIRVVVERRIPAVGDVADAVSPRGQVGPERGGVGCVGEDASHPDDGDKAVPFHAHASTLW